MKHRFQANFMNNEMNKGLTPFVIRISPKLFENKITIDIENSVANTEFCLAMNRLLTHTSRHQYNGNYSEFCIDYLDGNAGLLGQLSFSDTKISDITLEENDYSDSAVIMLTITLTYQDALFYSKEMLESNKGYT